MDSTITLGKDEWGAFLKDAEMLVRKYDSLYRELSEMAKSREDLEQRLQQAQERVRVLEEERNSKHVALDERKTLVDDTEGSMLIQDAEELRPFDGTERVHQLRSRFRRLRQIEPSE